MTRILTLACLLAVACDEKDTAEPTDTADTAETPFTPAEGTWDALDFQAVTDGCNVVEEGGDFTLSLAMTGETGFSLTGVELDLSCTLDDARAFTCDSETDVQDYTAEGADVVLTIVFGYSGSFSSETEGQMSYTVDASCEGADCGQLEKDQGLKLPCHSEAAASLSFAG